jgi:1,4-alpha-glucan branching enzyme
MKRTTLKRTKTTRKNSPHAQLVHLEFFNPQARAVFVAGSFNDWHPAATEMFSPSPGRWVKELTLPPGEHEYRLVVDGVWMADPSCARRAANPFGSENSVLSVQP